MKYIKVVKFYLCFLILASPYSILGSSGMSGPDYFRRTSFFVKINPFNWFSLLEFKNMTRKGRLTQALQDAFEENIPFNNFLFILASHVGLFGLYTLHSYNLDKESKKLFKKFSNSLNNEEQVLLRKILDQQEDYGIRFVHFLMKKKSDDSSSGKFIDFLQAEKEQLSRCPDFPLILGNEKEYSGSFGGKENGDEEGD